MKSNIYFSYSFSPFLLKSFSLQRARGVFAGGGSDIGTEVCVDGGEGGLEGVGDVTLSGVVSMGVFLYWLGWVIGLGVDSLDGCVVCCA